MPKGDRVVPRNAHGEEVLPPRLQRFYMNNRFLYVAEDIPNWSLVLNDAPNEDNHRGWWVPAHLFIPLIIKQEKIDVED